MPKEEENLLLLFKEVMVKTLEEFASTSYNVTGRADIACPWDDDDNCHVTTVDLKDPASMCTNFFLYSPVTAAIARASFDKVWQACKEPQVFLRTPVLRVAVVSAGPGCEVAGLCSALQEKKLSCQKVKLKILGVVEQWRPFFEATLKSAREQDFGLTSELLRRANVKSEVLVSDDVESLQGRKQRQALKKSDIVWMQELPGISDQTISDVPPIIASSLKEGSLLIVISSNDVVASGLRLIYRSVKLRYMFPTSSCSGFEDLGIATESWIRIKAFKKM